MAGFKTHITVSTLFGVGYGAGAYAMFGMPGPSCILAAGLCGVSGMLPDVDSDPGRPLRESLAFGAAVVATTAVERFRQFGLAPEMLILGAAAVYLLVRFGLGWFLQHYTVHRGMFHSLPAAVVFGEVAFLLFTGEVRLRCYLAGAVVIGYVSHLILDELYSVHYVRGRMAFKKSFGTALKIIGPKLWPNVSVYAKLAILTFLALKEPGWTEKIYQQRLEPTAQEWAAEFEEFMNSYDEQTASAASQPPRDRAPIETAPRAATTAQPRTTQTPDNPFGWKR